MSDDSWRAPGAVVAYVHDEAATVLGDRDFHMGRRSSRGVVDRFGDDNVGSCLGGGREPLLDELAELDGERRAVGQRPDGRFEPCLGEDRGEDAVGQVAQLDERLLHLLGARCQRSTSAMSPSAAAADRRQPQLVRRGEQALLRAVVEVALEPATCGVRGLDDARSGGLQVVELGEDLGAEPLVVDGESSGGSDLSFQVVGRCRARCSCMTAATSWPSLTMEVVARPR